MLNRKGLPDPSHKVEGRPTGPVFQVHVTRPQVGRNEVDLCAVHHLSLVHEVRHMFGDVCTGGAGDPSGQTSGRGTSSRRTRVVGRSGS